jgi:hypothetical protein
MPIEMRTHGLNWKAVMRRHTTFCALITDAWHDDPLTQRQYAYAQELGLRIFFCVKQGARLPEGADRYAWRVFTTTEELAALVKAIQDGSWQTPQESTNKD